MITIKKAENAQMSDVEAILSLNQPLNDKYESIIYFIAHENDKPIGVCGLCYDSGKFIIINLFISHEYENQQIEDSLIKIILNFADNNGVTEVFAITNEINPFKKVGFDFLHGKELREFEDKLTNKSYSHLKINVKEYFIKGCCNCCRK